MARPWRQTAPILTRLAARRARGLHGVRRLTRGDVICGKQRFPADHTRSTAAVPGLPPPLTVLVRVLQDCAPPPAGAAQPAVPVQRPTPSPRRSPPLVTCHTGPPGAGAASGAGCPSHAPPTPQRRFLPPPRPHLTSPALPSPTTASASASAFASTSAGWFSASPRHVPQPRA